MAEVHEVRTARRGRVWPAVVMPAAGTWTAHLRLDADDSSVANVVVTAS